MLAGVLVLCCFLLLAIEAAARGTDGVAHVFEKTPPLLSQVYNWSPSKA
jgi:hypothetical protein